MRVILKKLYMTQYSNWLAKNEINIVCQCSMQSLNITIAAHNKNSVYLLSHKYSG